jgi:Zn-dependent M28 family amino/carboxypeptidase
MAALALPWVSVLGGCGGPDAEPPAGPAALRCGYDAPAALAGCVDAERYEDDVERVAAERAPGTAHWQAVQDHCAETLAAAGFDVERRAFPSGVNVVATLPGSDAEQVIVGAHYDHLSGCIGADDNATGVAAVLEVARVLGPLSFRRTLVVSCWDQEELGLLGSTAHAEKLVADNSPVALAVNVDMIGFTSDEPQSQQSVPGANLLWPEAQQQLVANDFRADFIGLTADTAADGDARAFVAFADQLGLPTIYLPVPDDLIQSDLLADLRRSDHASFWAAGIAAVSISDSADLRNPYYHCAGGQDDLHTIDRPFATQVVRALTATVAQALEMAP